MLSFPVLAVAPSVAMKKNDNLGGFQLANVRPQIFAMPWHQWILWVTMGDSGYRTTDFHWGVVGIATISVAAQMALEVGHPRLCWQGSFSAAKCRTQKLCWQCVLCIPMWHMYAYVTCPASFLWTKSRKKQLRFLSTTSTKALTMRIVLMILLILSYFVDTGKNGIYRSSREHSRTVACKVTRLS